MVVLLRFSCIYFSFPLPIINIMLRAIQPLIIKITPTQLFLSSQGCWTHEFYIVLLTLRARYFVEDADALNIVTSKELWDQRSSALLCLLLVSYNLIYFESEMWWTRHKFYIIYSFCVTWFCFFVLVVD